MTRRVAIYGKGVTGEATGTVLAEAGCEVGYIDPPRKLAYGGAWPSVVFLCVPTPAGDDSIVVESALAAVQSWPDALVVVRSTVPPGTMNKIKQYAPDARLILMPEFLREAYAIEDARKKDRAIFAALDDEDAAQFKTFLVSAGYTGVRRAQVAEVELLKIALNSALAVKVAHANALYDLAKHTKADFNALVGLMVEDGWVSRFGLQVPGRHGRGYAGTCLPKDTDWLITALNERKLPGSSWLSAMQRYNRGLLSNNEECPTEVLK